MRALAQQKIKTSCARITKRAVEQSDRIIYLCITKASYFLLHKIDWDSFSSDLSLKINDITLPNLSSVLEIEILTHKLHIAINEVMDEHAPLIETKVRGSSNRWWNAELSALQPRVAGAFHKWRDHPTEINLTIYKALKLELTKLIRTRKRDSWREFCTESNTPKLTAILNKILSRNKLKDIALLKDDANNVSTDPTQSLNLLLDKSFPNSTPPPDDWTNKQYDNIQTAHEQTGYFFPKSAPWRDEDEIREAINDFEPFKAPGPDGIKPIILQHLPSNAISTLKYLFDSCLTAGYTPVLWRESRVIYLPKPGKTDYGKTNAYRPISLTSFMFKTLEKMVAKHIEVTYLSTSPYHKSQHAFRSGQSTITALSSLVNKIEEGINAFAKTCARWVMPRRSRNTPWGVKRVCVAGAAPRAKVSKSTCAVRSASPGSAKGSLNA